MKFWTVVICALLVMGCGGEDNDTGTTGGGDEPAPTTGGDMSTPRGSVEHQLALLMAGDVEGLKACFTPRLQDRITAKAVTEGAQEGAGMTLDDIFASMEEAEYEGRQTAIVKMKNGRTLTTLVLTDGRWLADTIWFR